MQLYAETHVGLVAAVLANHVFVEHVREWRFGLDASDRAGAHHHFLDNVKNIFLARERHFQVKLRKLRLTVGAQIFIAKTFDDLKIAVESANHQNLLEDLWRL